MDFHPGGLINFGADVFEALKSFWVVSLSFVSHNSVAKKQNYCPLVFSAQRYTFYLLCRLNLNVDFFFTASQLYNKYI